MSSSFLHDTSLFTLSAIVTAVIQLSGFAVAYALGTEVFYDILGGVNFLTVGIGTYLLSQDKVKQLEFLSPSTLASVLFVLSRGWLLLFLAWRAHSRKGDSRFDTIKGNFLYFLAAWIMQGLWVYIISMPLIFINNAGSASPLTTLEWIACIGFATGILVEVGSDVQKSLWVNNGRKGNFCTQGFWYYSRHPNYFGEIFQWWCCWIFAYGSVNSNSETDTDWWVWLLTVISPLFTMHILLNLPATGVWNAEGPSLKRYYEKENGNDYKQYRQRTSILIPMPTSVYENLPLLVKRLFFFEWKRYEYHPEKHE